MNMRVEKVGGIWHGTIDGHPEIDERGLTEEIARRKVLEVARRFSSAPDAGVSSPNGDRDVDRASANRFRRKQKKKDALNSLASFFMKTPFTQRDNLDNH